MSDRTFLVVLPYLDRFVKVRAAKNYSLDAVAVLLLEDFLFYPGEARPEYFYHLYKAEILDASRSLEELDVQDGDILYFI